MEDCDQYKFKGDWLANTLARLNAKAKAAQKAFQTQLKLEHANGQRQERRLFLCGLGYPPVRVDAEHRNNPANKTCARCKAVADAEGLAVADDL